MIESKKDTLLNDIIGGLLLFGFLGFPFWFPLVFIIIDLVGSGPIIQMLNGSGNENNIIAILGYFLIFIPGLTLYYMWKTTDLNEGKELDASGLNIKSLTDSKKDKSISLVNGSSINNVYWHSIDQNKYRLKRKVNYNLFTFPIMLFGLISWINYLIYRDGYSAFFNIGLVVTIVGLSLHFFFYKAANSGAVLDVVEKKFHYGKMIINFAGISDIYLIKKVQSSHSGGKVYDVYEANLTLYNGEKLNLLNHGSISAMLGQVELFVKHVDCPVYVSDKVLDILTKS